MNDQKVRRWAGGFGVGGFVVFLAGFRHLIRQARSDFEWIASLVFGAGLVVICLELMADGLEAGAALDTVVKADPSAVRGYVAALANLLIGPSILGGTNITGFYTASGIAPFVGQALMLMWFLFASLSMILRPQPVVPGPIVPG